MSAAAHRSITSDKATPSPTRRIAPRPIPGRRLSVLSLAAGALSLLAAPAVFGLVGVALGTVAIAKGDKLGGMAGIGASSALAVTGYYLALNLTA
jgi:hypothetical protein